MSPLERLLKYAFENCISIYIEPLDKEVKDRRTYVEVYNAANRSRAKKVVSTFGDIVPTLQLLVDEVRSGAQVDLVREIDQAADDYEFV